jgi:parallel beta-helix repeat protein
MKKLFSLILIFSGITATAQFTSPGNGETFEMTDLVAISSGTVTGIDGNFEINEALTIALGDTLHITTPDQIAVAPEVLITIEGALIVDAEALFTVQNCCDAFYEGIRLEAGAHTRLQNATFEYGGGIRVLGPDFEMQACTVRYQTTGASTGGALGLSNGKPKILNSLFFENESAAISSGANIAVAPIVDGNMFTGNNTGNTNRPQINLGPSGADTTLITNNTVIGYPENEQAGGIGFSSLTGVEAHAIISGNTVKDNRYGIAVIGGNIYSLVENNTIEDNNTQNIPDLGGSGINFFSAGANGHTVRGNVITGNLWGITLQGDAMPNLGEIDNPEVGPGNNIFENNGNNGEVYALYNNTPNPIWAQSNCWTAGDQMPDEAQAESVIFHAPDDAELGEVTFTPISVCILIPSVSNLAFDQVAELYPNPANGLVNIQLHTPADRVEILNVQGKTVLLQDTEMNDRLEIPTGNLASGLYFVRVSGEGFMATGKLVVQH